MNSIRRFVPGLSLALLVSLFVGPTTASAQYADPDDFVVQASARLVSGFGFARGIPHQGLMGDQAIRADVMFGKPGDWRFRIGPAVELRTACTLPILITCIHNQTLEGAAGPSLLIPFREGYPLTITPQLGYAFRRDSFGGDGFFVSNTLAWGYRPFNYFHWYAYGINAFVNHRFHLDDPSAWELTFGVELDMEFAIWTPILMIRMAFQNDEDPDAAEDPADPNERDVGGASTGAEPVQRTDTEPVPTETPTESPTEPAP